MTTLVFFWLLIEWLGLLWREEGLEKVDWGEELLVTINDLDGVDCTELEL